ncbi:hypothetical protein ElyMa_000486300 [Elysia marginata]|uniref:Receptor ligand binding region domain-containing protein n=1 Tax=Elysia marginata TaxID=1093978 RepID=A0AAV4FU74_9GAST|nr:hypothetical protein ElyMa_000486300 [Elysia marginata]
MLKPIGVKPFREYATHIFLHSQKRSCETSSLAQCKLERAGTSVLLHAVDSTNKEYRRIMLHAVDTEVLVMAVSTDVYHEDTYIWVAFGTCEHLRYILMHDIAKELIYEKARCAFPMFHASTGCDTVSSFAGRGKRLFDI